MNRGEGYNTLPRSSGHHTEGINTLPRHRDKGGSVRVTEGDRDRPLSLYDNLKNEQTRESPSRSLGPSMASAMVTTVPQNIAALKIEGRHAPTRTSLRHSRMIVLTRQGKVPRKYLPRVVKRHKLATSLLILQLLMGIAICTLAAWLLLWAPNLHFTNIPYWSGLPVLMASFIGIVLLCSCRKEYPGMPVKYHVLAFKVMSIFASFGASVASFVAAGFSGHHLFKLQGMICEPANVLNSQCWCRSLTDILTYQDLNCLEVLNILTVLLIASVSANVFAGFLSAWYLCLHLTSHTNAYTQVRANDDRPIILTNKN